MPRFKLFPRYRKPSVGELLGTTQFKRKVSRKYGIAKLRHPIKTPVTNLKRRGLRRIGYYSGWMKLFRFLRRR